MGTRTEIQNKERTKAMRRGGGGVHRATKRTNKFTK